MKIAIHHRKGSFSDRWIEYCKKHNISYKVVNAYDSDIIKQLIGFDALIWHHHHNNVKDVLAAKSILFALEHANVKVFPNFYTGWHFDNKVAQKYLLEALGAPMVTSYVYYDKKEALDWSMNTIYPKVFKLKGGAGAANVKLVKNQKECKKLIEIAFGKGFSQFDSFGNLKEKIYNYKQGKDNFISIMKGIGRLIIPTEFSKSFHKEKGYVYFQDFLPFNDSDIRVIVVSEKAFAIKRVVRENDFRASGSGNIIYSIEKIDQKCIKIAFDINKKIKSQSVAFDFIFDDKKNPLIVEISYGYSLKAYDNCEGYWTEDMQFHKGKFNPQAWMVENLMQKIKDIEN